MHTIVRLNRFPVHNNMCRNANVSGLHTPSGNLFQGCHCPSATAAPTLCWVVCWARPAPTDCHRWCVDWASPVVVGCRRCHRRQQYRDYRTPPALRHACTTGKVASSARVACTVACDNIQPQGVYRRSTIDEPTSTSTHSLQR